MYLLQEMNSDNVLKLVNVHSRTKNGKDYIRKPELVPDHNIYFTIAFP